MEERRTHQRIPITSIARLTLQERSEEIRALIRDISTHGIGICYRRKLFRRGDLVSVRLSLLNGYHTLTELIEGEIVWVGPLQRRGDFGIGIRFDEMKRNHPILYRYVETLTEMTSSAVR
ncbi:MAG: PilZ domain-containing protein [Nitrospirae bacterium]|nr:PilZ domain-containing protein [Candidatus Manganitrophaceae bacterium]